MVLLDIFLKKDNNIFVNPNHNVMQYTWIPFYKEFANKLLHFQDNRRPLVEWIYANIDSIGYLHTKDKKQFTDLDPFTVIGTFNRSLSDEKRIKICSLFKQFLQIEAGVPSDFEGIPILSYTRNFFLPWDESAPEQPKIVENYWHLLKKALEGEPFKEEYDLAISQEGINNMVSMALFWINPDDYLSLDSTNRKLLNYHGIKVSASAKYDEYMEIVRKVRALTSNFPAFSKQAFNTFNSDRPNIWIWTKSDESYEPNTLAIGSSFQGIKDFQQFKSKEELRAACQKDKGNTDVALPNAYWKFMKEVKKGDIVVISKPISENNKYHREYYGWGVFETDLCRFDKNAYSPVIREVEWKETFSTPVKDYNIRNTIFFHKPNDENSINILRLLNITPTEIDTIKNNMEIDNTITQAADLIHKKGQIILQGAPGTGKTYITRSLAVYLCDESLPETREELMSRYKELEKDQRIGFTTFHQSMDYVEFVEGLKPVSKTDDMRFEVKHGIFRKICSHAEKDTLPHVLIVDEINRANISKVLGELITLIEWSKRKNNDDEYEVELPYSGEHFGVPNNLYIVGTMNTADRSLGYIDYAIRRRFAFYTLKSERDVIENADFMEANAKLLALKLFEKVSELIRKNINDDIDFDDVMVGHSYFLAKTTKDIRDNMHYEIVPLLLEYLRDGILREDKALKEEIINLPNQVQENE